MLAERDRLAAALESANKEATSTEPRQATCRRRSSASGSSSRGSPPRWPRPTTRRASCSATSPRSRSSAAEQKAAVVRLTAELAALKDELARLSTAARRRRRQGQGAAGADRRSRPEAQPRARQQGRGAGPLPLGVLRQAARGAGAASATCRSSATASSSSPKCSSPPGRPSSRTAARSSSPSVAQRLVEIASTIPKDINWVLQVDGHTDNKPIASRDYPVELGAVCRPRHRRGQVPPQRRHPQRSPGGGRLRRVPAASPTDTARNRRIELKLTNR